MEATRTEVIRKENEKKTLDIQINDSIGYLFIKRTLDIVASLIGMVVLFPSLVLVALLIKIEDPKGPIFLSKRGLAKMVNSFRCTNSVLW